MVENKNHKYLVENRKKLLEFEKILEETKSYEYAVKLANLILKGVFGLYYSEVLESFFVEYGRKIKSIIHKPKIVSNSTLHVFTEVYKAGGHTRIGERWIQSAPNNETHSVVIINQKIKDQIPENLIYETKNKNGNIDIFSYDLTDLEKARKLRELASSFELIVLHHHPQDPVPLMAFSSKDFERPIICFNHSGHTFWLGRNIVDYAIDIEKNQQLCTLNTRGILNSSLVNMPLGKSTQVTSLLKKENLGFKPNSKVIVSMASSYKYKSIDNLSFIDMLYSIMLKNTNICFIGIGVEALDLNWQKIKFKFPKRIALLGIIPNNRVADYLKMSDLYLDSFPFNSWVSLIDAIHLAELPCLLLKTPIGYPPFLENTYSICNSIDEMVIKIDELFVSKVRLGKLSKDLNIKLKKKCSLATFQKEIYSIKKEVLNNNFKKRQFKVEVNYELTDYDYYFYDFKVGQNKELVTKKYSFFLKKTIFDRGLYFEKKTIVFGCVVSFKKKYHI